MQRRALSLRVGLRTKTQSSTDADPAVQLDPNNSTSLKRTNPTDLGNLRMRRARAGTRDY